MSKLLSHEEAVKKSLTVKWKTSLCSTGESCWCRIIEPAEAIETEDGPDIFISGSGDMPKEYAEHIVELHNKSL